MGEFKKNFGVLFRKLQSDKKALLTVSVGVLGMLLVLLSEIPLTGNDSKDANVTQNGFYNDELERETEKLISEIEGAGKVSVMLTYEATEETVWAKEIKEKTNGEDSSDMEEKYIIVDTAQGESGLAVKIIYPKIRGVAVVCNGADDPVVASRIKSLLSALFDIGSNRISIARRGEQE